MASTIVPKKVMPERLRIVLNHFGLTQSKLGGLIGFRHSIISLWLRGKNKMPQAAAMAIQAALGVRWQWTLYGDGEMLLDDMGVLSAEEVWLLTLYRQCDMTARQEIIDQTEYQVGKSERRADKGA